MGELSQFLKQNKKKRESVTYAATKSLCDKNGKPLLWEIKPLSTRENEEMKDSCLKEVPLEGKTGLFRQKLDTGSYLRKMMAASVTEPNLYNAKLQDSYGVKTPEDLLVAMVDNPGEYQALARFVEALNGFDETMQMKVDTAKN